MRLFFILSLSVHLFATTPFELITPSTPEEIFSLSSGLLAEKYVSVSSGQISLSETDLCVKGAQDLLLKRTYIPPQIMGSYDDNEAVDRLELGKALLQLKTHGWVVHPHLWAGTNHNSLFFQVRDPQGFVLEFEIQGRKGILKTSSYGCSNLRGEEPSSSADIRNIELLVEGEVLKITWPDGIERHYKRMGFFYRLERELLPNGKAINYEYNNQVLSNIFSSDLSGKYVYASIALVKNHHYRGSDGREVNLVYASREIRGEYKKKRFKEKGTFTFPLMEQATNPIFTNTVGYNERTLLTSYDAKAFPISCSYFQLNRVISHIQTFSTPSGSTFFSYTMVIPGLKEGFTTITHSNGAQVVYRFNKLLLLAAIENWLEGKLINKKTFAYDNKQHIKEIETLDGDGNLLIAKRFECDKAGNPTLEKREGDFGVFSIRRKFDQNRLVFEDRDDGLQYAFTYLGNTRLVTSKTTLAFGEKQRKTTYQYDEANNLVVEEEEGKTRRLFQLYQTAPHLHRIEWEEKTTWEDALIYKIHYAYDQWGNTVEERYFGSDEKFAYAIERTYNKKGELLCETNPLGQQAVYQYDERGRCICEKPVSNGMSIGRTFDAKGRVCALTENDHETRYAYNSSDELIEKTDYLGIATKYQYHPVHGKPNLIEKPSSVTRIIYDSFGREKERIDACKGITKKEHIGYGGVAKITYPEGGEETYSYNPNGLLKSFQDPDGLKTTYSRDALGRVVEKTVGSNTTLFHYDAYNLKEVIDAEGYCTAYRYDAVGQKIEEKRANWITRYGYDPLGFVAWEEKGNRRTEFSHDALGQLRKKSIDGLLETTWEYDSGGNIVAIEQGGLTTFTFDAHNRLIKAITPEGNTTSISYARGSQVLIKKIINPLGIETIETYNPQGQLEKKEVAGQLVENFSFDPLFRVISQDHLTFGYFPNGNKAWMKEAETKTTNWTYTQGNRVKTKQKSDGTILVYKYDKQQNLIQIGSQEFFYDSLERMIGGTGFSRTLDPFGNIKREEWSNGLWIESDYDDWNRPLERRLPDQTRISYQYEGPFLKKVIRYGKNGAELYCHTYGQRDAKGNPLSEQGLFSTTYSYDQSGRKTSQKNPYFQETIDYDPAGNIVRKGNTTYTYDALSQMTSESDRFRAKYDAHYNLKELNDQQVDSNDLNQITSLSYDLNGNLQKPGYLYDEFDQLIEVKGERSVYDALGRRLQKGETAFLYIGDEEIGAFEGNQPKELKIQGLTPIAIEIEGKPYRSIVDVQETIRLLIGQTSGRIFKKNQCDAFGFGLTDEIPYAYAGKRFDPKTGLIYFGKRYYDPALRRWLTPDPLGPVDHSNLYQYVMNNPYLYRDPTGESIGGYLLGLGEVVVGAAIMITGGVIEFGSFGTLTVGVVFAESAGAALIGHGLSLTTHHAKDFSFSKSSPTWNTTWKNTDVYAPDRPLPLTDDGIFIPDTDAPHTQLGTRDGKKGKYPQAREFDANGNRVRDIDFTDHGYPKIHPNPHQHRPKPNPSGGTPERGDIELVPEWRYQ
jgi:RHS repeat-associated protein